MEKIKLLSLFSGIGAFEKALKNLNIDFELVNYLAGNSIVVNVLEAILKQLFLSDNQKRWLF